MSKDIVTTIGFLVTILTSASFSLWLSNRAKGREDKREDRKDEITRLLSDNAVFRTELKELQIKLDKVKEQNDEYYRQIVNLTAENATLKTENTNLRFEFEEFKKAVRDNVKGLSMEIKNK